MTAALARAAMTHAATDSASDGGLGGFSADLTRFVAEDTSRPERKGSGLSQQPPMRIAGGTPALVRLDARGRVVRRTALHDASAQLAVSGRDAWFVGNGGHGDGIVHVRLAR